METIIGFGDAGCNVADKFSEHSQYKIYKINTHKSKEPNYLYITPRSSHAESSKSMHAVIF